MLDDDPDPGGKTPKITRNLINELARIRVSGSITQNTIWRTNVDVTDTVIVNSGATLTLNPGIKIRFAPNTALVVNGVLVGKGTTQDSIKFLASGNNPQPGDWYGIKLGSSAACTLSYCSLGYASYGIDMASNSKLKIYRSSLYNCDNRAIENSGGTALVQYCRINNSDYGVHGYINGTTRVENTSIKNIAAIAINNTQGRLYVNHCTLDSCSVEGICSWRPTTQDSILNTVINTRRYGIYWGGSNSVLIEGCSIQNIAASGSYYGIYAYKSGNYTPDIFSTGNSVSKFNQIGIYLSEMGSNGNISQNDVSSCGTYGGYWYNSTTPINSSRNKANKFAENTCGLKLDYYSSATVRKTKFWDNKSYGAYVASNSTANFGVNTGTPPDSGLNSFKATNPSMAYRDLYNAGFNQINAKLNYWGEATPNSTQIVGAIYSPYLGSDPLPRREAQPENILPEDFTIATAYPNPFNPSVSIRFNISSPSYVSVIIFNILGQDVQTVLGENLPAGEKTVIWDGKNRYGGHVASGLYFCQLSTPFSQKTIKITALK